MMLHQVCLKFYMFSIMILQKVYFPLFLENAFQTFSYVDNIELLICKQGIGAIITYVHNLDIPLLELLQECIYSYSIISGSKFSFWTSYLSFSSIFRTASRTFQF